MTALAGVRAGPRAAAAERFDRWLLENMPPFSGRLRLVFYGGSLVLFALLNDGLGFTLGEASPHLYQPRGIAALLRVPYVPPNVMRTLMAATYLAWACAAVGLMTRPAKVLTAIGMFLAVGFEQAYETGSNHTHYLLLYSLVALSFSASDRGWSVDGWIRRRRGSTVEAEGGAVLPVAATGLPRQAILIVAVSLYFASGLSKLADAGPRWIDGQSLQYYIGSQVDRTSFEVVTSLRLWVSEQRWLCRILSAGALLIEVGSPLALFSLRLRHLWIAAWISMHLGILLLMAPNYWIHSWCVGVLLTDWAWLKRSVGARSLAGRDPAWVARVRSGPRMSVGARTLALFLVAAAALLPFAQIEWFPITHVPMYASYVTPDLVGGVPVRDFDDEARVRELARRCAGNRAIGHLRRCPWRVPRALVDRVTLELDGPGLARVPFAGDVGGLRYPVIERLAATSEPAASRAATELGERVRALLSAQAAGSSPGYDRFRLEYRLSGGTILLTEGAYEGPQ